MYQYFVYSYHDVLLLCLFKLVVMLIILFMLSILFCQLPCPYN